MTTEEINNLLKEALNRFSQGVEELRREHQAEIEKILTEIKTQKLEQVKKDLGI